MAGIDDIAAQVVRPLNTSATRVVADAFRLVIAPAEQYDEGTVALEKLEFAAFAVGGLSAAATLPGAGQVRSSSRIDIPLSDSAGHTAGAGITVSLYGPGDVRGIDPAQIVRRYPTPGTANAEETVLAHIEFDRPELPWAFSAAPATGDLRPWITLIVVEKGAASWEPATGLLPVLRVSPGQLPSLANVHLWAHAQAPQTDNGAKLDVRLSPEYAPVNLSRLVSPRMLTQDTDYIAAVVPTTDVGMRGGRGLTGGTLEAAWDANAADDVLLPVYDSWEFRTGPDGDFATLALRLDGVAAPYEVGRRFIDASEPGTPLSSLPDGDAGAKQVLRCALFSPSPPPADRAAAEDATWPAAEVDELHAALDRPAEIEGAQERTGGVPDLPIVGPRIYGAHHRGTPMITGDDWFAELNLAPLPRIVAGLGTRVVQRDQEQLMQSAWAQLGEVEKANRAIRLAQLAELLAERLHDRIAKFEVGHLVQIAAPLASRVSLTGGQTFAADIAGSATPVAAVSGAFRRSMRPGGPVMRRADAAAQARIGEIVGTDGGMRDFTREYRNPDGIGGLSAASIAMLDTSVVAKAIDASAREVPEMLTRASAGVKGGIATYLTEPSQWSAPRKDFDLAGAIAQRWRDQVVRETPAQPALVRLRAQRVGPLMAELSQTTVAARTGIQATLESEAVSFSAAAAPEVVAQPPAGPGPIGGVRVGHGVRVVGGHGLDVAGEGIDVGAALVAEQAAAQAAGQGAQAAQPGFRARVLRDAVVQDAAPANPIAGAVGRIAGVGGLGAQVRQPAARRIGGLQAFGQEEVAPDILIHLAQDAPAATRTSALKDFAKLASVRVTPFLDKVDELPLDRLRAEMIPIVDPGGLLEIEKVPRRATLVADGLVTAIDPRTTVRAALDGRLRISGAIADRWRQQTFITPIMAAPHFDRAMYSALHDYNPDWLVPGLGLLPADDFVTVLSTNSEFMEAFFVGLSDEMGRELLWRNYPTDQRGTYFRRFWDDKQDELGQRIHAFSHQPLGTHISIGGTGGSDPRAVIVVKSELVRRYPDLIIQAVKSQNADVLHPVFERADGSQETAEQLFAAYLEPDVALIGVDLAISEFDRKEWWILIAEHPTATRFGRPLDAQVHPGERFMAGSGSGAAFAQKWLHDPVRVAFQATDIIVTGA